MGSAHPQGCAGGIAAYSAASPLGEQPGASPIIGAATELKTVGTPGRCAGEPPEPGNAISSDALPMRHGRWPGRHPPEAVDEPPVPG